MTPEAIQGRLVRFMDLDSDLLLVIEPDGDDDADVILGQVQEVVFHGITSGYCPCADLMRNLGDSVWIAAKQEHDGWSVEVAGDWFPPGQLRCSGLSCSKRDYDMEDLRQKCLRLSQSHQHIQNAYNEASERALRLRDRIVHFIIDRRGRWMARREFYAKSNPEKANLLAERLALLDEIESLLGE